jgi:hypothetical protein
VTLGSFLCQGLGRSGRYQRPPRPLLFRRNRRKLLTHRVRRLQNCLMALETNANTDTMDAGAWFKSTGEVREFAIYHIVGRKIGCTTDLKRRTKQYRKEGELRPLEVVEIFTGTATQAGDREHHWADHYGYLRRARYENNWSVTVYKPALKYPWLELAVGSSFAFNTSDKHLARSNVRGANIRYAPREFELQRVGENFQAYRRK